MKTNLVKKKIEFINQGYQVLNSKYRPNGDYVVSFSLPVPIMKGWKKLRTYYGSKREALEFLVDHYVVPLPKQNGKTIFYHQLRKEAMEFSDYQSFSHNDYKFDSAVVDMDRAQKIEQIKNLYGISRSAVIRIMVEAMMAHPSWKI